MNPPEQPTRMYVSHGQQVIAERIDRVYYIEERRRESVRAHALGREEIEHLLGVYTRTPASDSAVGFLRDRSAVALVGPPGCGRRITSVAAITKLGATPHPVYLDPDDTRRDLPAEPGCGYLVDIDDQAVHDIPGLKDLIGDYREQLSAKGAYLVIRATPMSWTMLGQQIGIAAVTVQPPGAVDVFRSHLDYVRQGEAARWVGHPDVMAVLDNASPADAVRFAGLADASMASASSEDAIAQSIAAYKNWTAELVGWFGSHKEGYHRALLIAAAVLNEADAASVFNAANRLSQEVKLERPSGGGLVGDGVARILEQVGAVPTADGRIVLSRPAYPESVLDHVWCDRPHLRADLERWLIDLPAALQDPAATYAGYSLVDLAIRQADPTLITRAVGKWAEQVSCRTLAATALTEAGVSDSIGRAVRRTMYTWAANAGTTESLQLTVADVCGGLFGKSFPRNAMTRLRHLSLNGGPKVHERVVASLKELANEPEMRKFMLGEIANWATNSSQVHVPGVRAFLALGADNVADVVPRTLQDSTRIEVLAKGLRAALHDAQHVVQAREMCCGWLEAAAQEELAVDVVTDIIARTCQDSYDIGLLAPVVWRWGQASDSPAVVPRDTVAAVLLQKAADRDPLTPGVSAAPVYVATSEGDR